ncbi:hypothetical protein AB0K16_43155 [Nonomuraea jabiensis]|uniref:hypothetical protein n=1 Tax=Nonomuraea jabiensis TaxID=882448 RepID=UPI003416F958
MLSRSKRIFGIAILSAAAAAAFAVPAHASHVPVGGVIPYQLMSAVQAPLCLTTGTLSGDAKMGIPLVEELLPTLGASCAVLS